MENLRAFEIKYFGATNNKGSRIRIHDLRHNKTKFISYDYELNDIAQMGENFLKSLGITCLYRCETEKAYIILTKNFDIQIK